MSGPVETVRVPIDMVADTPVGVTATLPCADREPADAVIDKPVKDTDTGATVTVPEVEIAPASVRMNGTVIGSMVVKLTAGNLKSTGSDLFSGRGFLRDWGSSTLTRPVKF